MKRYLIYFGIGLFVHVRYWQMPLDLHDWRLWADVALWPFVLLWDWPKLLAYLPNVWTEGLGYLIGVIFVFAILRGISEGIRRKRNGDF